MKKSITLFVILFIINITIIHAQQLQPNSTIKANHNFYKIDSSKYSNMEVYNAANTLHKRVPKINRYDLYFKKDDKFSLINSFKQVFDTARLTQLESEPGILLTFMLSPTGKVLEVTFIVKKNTLISVAELEALENAIKKNVTFTLHADQTKGGDFFVIGQNVLFKRVLDGTLDSVVW